LEWIDLNVKLPDTGKWVLGLTNAIQGDYEKMGGGIFQIRRIGERVESGYERLDWLLPHYVRDDAIFTHWMKIPNFPKNPLDKNLYISKCFIFPENNDIPWGQDFCCYRGDIPHNIKFELTDFINDERVTLRAKGYGVISRTEEKAYGNGSICVEIKDIIPYVIID